MKRRLHSRSTRTRKVVRWFSSNATYVDRGTVITVGNTVFTPTAQIMAQHVRQTSETPDLVELNERHTIEAIRGEIVYHAADTAGAEFPSILHLGIRIVDLLPTGVPQSYSPSTSNEADDPWMWLCHRFVPPAVSQGTGWALEPSIPVHIKTRRVLRPNQALCLMLDASAAFPSQSGANVEVYPYLRTLVSHPE